MNLERRAWTKGKRLVVGKTGNVIRNKNKFKRKTEEIKQKLK